MVGFEIHDVLVKKRGKITKKTDLQHTYSEIAGSWLECLEFDRIRYWDIEKIEPVRMQFLGNPIPSDSRYREDLKFLKEKNLAKAQE